MPLQLPGPLIATDWLAAHLEAPDLVLLDATFTLPGATPDAAALYARGHIPGARFFDIDRIADPSQSVPHMLPSPEAFADHAARLGLGDGMAVVVYDGPGLMSAARAWWMLRVFGHDNVAILDGGLRAWTAEGRPVTGEVPVPRPARFTPAFRPHLLRDRAALLANLDSGIEQVVDARAAARFEGRAPEPRAGLRSGHIPGSRNLPFTALTDPATGRVLPPPALAKAVRAAGVDPDGPGLVASCGSGVTAGAIAFALFLLGRDDVAVYDGSWAEWGEGDAPVATGSAQLPALLDRLGERFGPRLSTSYAMREQHAGGEAWHALKLPDAVVMARSTEEVAFVLRACTEAGIPVIPHGAGTSLEGHLSAPSGGISVDLTGMDRVLRTSAEDMDCTVQAGVTREALNTHLRDQGLFFPIDPGANATLGGMAATRASGTNAVRYGTMREVVLALTVVLPDGEVISTASRARKSSAGYDLTRLFVGSEGTLGIITEVTLRLFGIPQAISAAVCGFDSVEAAVQAATTVVQFGVPVARMELMDRELIRMVNARFGLSLPVADTLAFEFHGSEAGVAEQADTVAEIVADHGGTGFEAATDPEARARLWKARHNAWYAIVGAREGAKGWSSDVCVPVSELAGSIRHAQALLKECPLPAAILGHVGDGNFHVVFALDPSNADEVAAVKAVNARLVEQAIAAGGTCTGEHGIGSGKIDYMPREHDAGALRIMRAIKAAIDPLGVMNPGKILPDGS